MRRFISMLLCVTIILGAFPAYVFAAPELDFDVENANDPTVESVAGNLAAITVPDYIPVYTPELGELVYLEDFEDETVGACFSNGTQSYIYTSMTVCDDPAGEGDKAGLNTSSIMTAQVNNPSVKHFDSVTVMAEAYVPASKGSASGWCRVAFNDAKCDWSTYKISETDKWITVSETVTNIDAHSSGSWIYELSGNGVYFDNFRAYAKYDLGEKVRFVDGNTLKFADAADTCKALTPTSAGNNAWVDDAGVVYFPGDTVEKGKTLTATKAEAPIALYDKNLGELVYLENFEDGSAGGAYKTLGNNAYIWTAGNIIDNPNGSGKAFVSTEAYTQLMLNGSYSVKGSEVTFMVDFLNHNGATANIPVCFMDKWLDPWNFWTNDQISTTDWTTKSVTKAVDTDLTSTNMRFYFGGMGLAVDNVRVYAKYDLGNKSRFVEKTKLTLIDGGSKAPVPVNADNNAWEAEDGTIYFAGDIVPAGLTLFETYAEPVEDGDEPEVVYENPVYLPEFGELVYLEDFEDGSAGGAYTTLGNNAYIWTAGNIIDNPNGEGKAFVSTETYTQLVLNGSYSVKGSEVTFMVDFLNHEGATANIPVCFMDKWLDPWDYWKNSEISTTAWTTKTVTKSVDTNLTSGNMRFYFGGKGLAVDNVRVYAKYDLGTKTRFVDGNTLHLIDAENGCTALTPKAPGKNAWKDESGKLYFPGDTVTAGKTLTAVYMPETFDAELGTLIYFEDFSDGTWDKGYTTGKNAYFYQNGGVEAGKKYGTGMYPSIMEIVDVGIGAADDITFIMDVKKVKDSTATGVAIWGSGFEAWPAFSVSDVTDDAWTTKTKTFKNVTLNKTGITQMCFGFAGLYVDNIKIYANESIGNAVKFIDLETVIESLDGITEFTFPAIANTQKNIWVDKDGNEYKPGDKVNASDIAGKTFTSILKEFEEVVELDVSANEITVDRGTVTVKPVISYVTGVVEADLSDVIYTTDTANASLTVNDDGSVTVTGQINGDVTVTAVLPDRIKDKLSECPDYLEAVIAVSGQSDRIVGNSFKVMMFGNSIRSHGPSASLGWPGNWGMAASSEDKDYAHRFIYYMEEKFGEGSAELVDGYTPANFETAAASCTNYNPADFVSYVNGFKNYVVANKPDIITLQLGENGSESVKADIYAKVMAQVINGIKEVAPDAIIVISAPFWSAETSGKVVGTYKAAEECGIYVAPVYTLGQGAWDGSNPNMAFNAPWVTDKTSNGVKAHPGDEGMDNIAKMFFEKVNYTLSTSDKIKYTTIPESIEIDTDDLTITEVDGTLKLTATVSPADASQNVVWSLVSEDAINYASISSSGVLTAINNGTVTVRAATRYNEEIFDEVDVTITGQTDPFTVTFDGNGSDAVVPEANHFAKKGFRLDKIYASRPEYKFLGWSLEKDGEVVDALDETDSDVTVYAVWAVADCWDFEREGYAEDYTFVNAFHQKVVEGKLSVTATGTAVGTVLAVNSPKLKLIADDYALLRINMQITEKDADSVVKLVITSGGETKEYSVPVTSTSFADYYFDLAGLNGSITGFTLSPASRDCAVNIDEIKFLKAGEADYSKKPAKYSEDYGNLVFFDNFSGEDFGNTADVVIAGPNKTAVNVLGKKAVGTDAAALGDFVLSGIVVKAADGETFKYTDGRIMDGTLTAVFEMYNGTDKQYSYYNVADKNPGGWDAWAGYYTGWNSIKAQPGIWMTHKHSTSSTNKAAFGNINSNGINDNVKYASVALYFQPKKALKLSDSGKTTLIDLTDLDTVTLPVPSDESLYGWTDGVNDYLANETVAVSKLEGVTLIAEEVNAAKISYEGTDEKDFVWLENSGTAYTVKNDNYPAWDISLDGTLRDCIGWSTEENSDTAVEEITVTGDVTLYPVWEIISEAVDYEIEVSGAEAIEIDNIDRTYEYTVAFTPEIEYNTVTWSVSDESVATIDENGVLTPIKDGNVTVTAKADYYPGKTASVDVAITYKEGYAPITVSFEGDVTALPESFEIIPGKTFDLGEYINMTPSNSAKRFNGWNLNGGSEIYTGEVTAESTDMVFTALVNYDFNFAVPQNVKGYYNHGKWEQKDDMLVCIPNGSGQDNFAEISGLSVPASRFEAVEYYMDINYTRNGEVKQFTERDKGMEFYFTTDSVSNKYHSADVTGFTEDGKYAIITTNPFDGKWSGTLKAIRNDFLGNNYDFGYSIRYIRFVEKPQMEETILTIDGIDAPVTGFAPDTLASISENYASIDSITWSCASNDSFLATGNFNENTVYTVTVKVSCTDTDKIFNDVITATVNGEDADVSFATDGSALVSYTFAATDAFMEYEAYITGKDVITRAGRSVQYKFNVTNNEIPDKTAVWSVDNTEIAVITDEGKLVAKKNGNVTITAVSNYNPNVTATFDVTIQDLEEKYINVVFDKGTADEVTNMPEDMYVQVGKIVLPEVTPVRDGYIFLGWTEGNDSIETVEYVIADEDVTLVALWGTGHVWNFNNSKDGFAVDGGTITVSDTYLIAKTTGFPDIRLYSPATDFDPKQYNKILVRLATETAEKTDVFFGTDGAGISAGKMQNINHEKSGLDNWQTLAFDFSANGQYMSASKITKLWVDPFDVKNNTAYIDYIAVLDNNRTITFNAGEGTLPDAYANGITKEIGTKVSLTEEATLDGYTFLGWSMSEGGDVLTSITVRDNTTLYAVYGENVNSDTASLTLADDEVLLVKAPVNTTVTVTYTANGEEKTGTVTTNLNGYGIIEVETETEITNITVNPENTEATVAKADVAEEITNAVPVESDTTIKHNGVSKEEDTNSSTPKYDYTVEELTKPGTIHPEGMGDAEGSVSASFAKGAPVVFEFEEEYEKNLFSGVEALERGYEPESVLSYRIFSKKADAAVTPSLEISNLALDSNEFKYIVVRARTVGFENPNLRIYFMDDDNTSYTKLASVFNALTDEYAVYVYDMSANKNWSGTVSSLKFVCENNTTGSIDFDWIMFTDEIPEDTTAFDKAYDIFDVCVEDKMTFTDIAKNEWSYTEIAQSYKRGFVKGMNETTFAPKADVTVAEAVTIAVRLNHIFNGKDAVENATTGNWYDTYVEAAIKAKIIKKNQFTDFDRPATRREVAMIMKNAVPSYYLGEINMFDEIPDVEAGSEGEKHILALYKAGVVNGTDAQFNFLPEKSITREELAAIVNRIALPSARKRTYTDLERIANRKVYEGNALTSIAIWSCKDDRFTIGDDGIGRTIATGTDPILILDTMTGRFNGKDVQKIRMGIVWDKEKAKLEPQLYYGTITSPGHAWQRMVTGTIGETDERGVTEVVFDMSTHSAFQDTVRDLRFDPFDLKDVEFGIAYLILE